MIVCVLHAAVAFRTREPDHVGRVFSHGDVGTGQAAFSVSMQDLASQHHFELICRGLPVGEGPRPCGYQQKL
jgi:hypothetical protein